MPPAGMQRTPHLEQRTRPAGGNNSGIMPPPNSLPSSRSPRPDFARIGFWFGLSVAAGAGGAALAWPAAVGSSGTILLLAFSVVAFILLLWTMGGVGRVAGLFPSPKIEISDEVDTSDPGWINALDESALITDLAGGEGIVANMAYMQLLEAAGLIEHNNSKTIPTPDILFSGNAATAALVYRLARSAAEGQTRSEHLPPVKFSQDMPAVRFEAIVSPLGDGRALWRIRRWGDRIHSGDAETDPSTQFVEDAPLGFFSARPDGRVVYANAVLRDMLGLAPDLSGVTVKTIIGDEGAQAVKRTNLQSSGDHVEVEIRTNGIKRPAFLSSLWVGPGADALSRSVLHFGPAPRRQPIIASADKSRSDSAGTSGADPILLAAPFAVLRLDGHPPEKAAILEANAPMMALIDNRVGPGTAFVDLFENDAQGVSVAQMLKSGTNPAELTLTGSDCTLNVNIICNGSGGAEWACLIDMSAHKRMEMRLAQGEKMQAIGKLAGGVAHDFNNLLQGMMLNADKLLIRHPVGDPSYFELKSINQLATRGSELVRMLLAYSRQQTFRQEVLDISDLLSDYHVLLRQLIDERIKLNVMHGRDLPRVRADRAQIETALTNLATNARDSMLEKAGGGELMIRTSMATAEAARMDGFPHIVDGEYLLIEVCDNGIGMPKAIRDKIFEPFFTTKSEDRGTGLGLATVYGIVKQSGGFIYPVSEEGQGTVFKVFLPAYEGGEEESPQIAPIASNEDRVRDLAGRGRILLVEDEDAIRGVAAELLGSRGYQVMQAADGEEALSLIEQHAGEIDLLISDVVLPGIDGPGVLKKARVHIPEARVIFISGYAEQEFTRTLDEEQGISFLPKPFTLKELAAKVKAELETARAA